MAELARKYSISPEAEKGGSWGGLHQGDWKRP
jgi:hypothetical protein